MKDKLERFIRDNREDFDADEPPASLWEKLDRQLPPEPKRLNGHERLPDPWPNPFLGVVRSATTSASGWWGGRIGLAAAVSLLLLAAAFGWVNYRYGVTEQPEVVAVSPTYAREVTQYARMIDTKRSELKQLTESNPTLYRQFATDLERLERSYQTLKADLPANPNQEVLIQAMIQNLQLQIDLLNQQLDVIQRIKQHGDATPNPIL